jgi:hypothetical protein
MSKGREGKERKGKERKGKERKGKERKGKERINFQDFCNFNKHAMSDGWFINESCKVTSKQIFCARISEEERGMEGKKFTCGVCISVTLAIFSFFLISSANLC